jgi:hypothetical protein
MLRRSLYLTTIVVLSLIIWLGSVTGPGVAFPISNRGLNALAQQPTFDPTTDVVMKNHKAWGLKTVVWLPAPSEMETQLDNLLPQIKAKAQKAKQAFDMDRAIYYFSYEKPIVRAIIVPLASSGKQDLQTQDAISPDTGNPAKVVGAIFAPELNTSNPADVMILVYDLQNKNFVFYDQSLKPVATPPTTTFELRNFAGQQPGTTNNAPWQGDEGGLISAERTCFTVGLAQVCFTFTLRDSRAQEEIQGVEAKLDGIMNSVFQATAIGSFDEPNTMPDLIGHDQRTKCAFALNPKESKQDINFTLNNPTTPTDCQPSTIFAAPRKPLIGTHNNKPVQLIAIIVVNKDIALDIQNNPDGEIIDPKDKTPGKRIPSLKPGTMYLMTTPWINAPAGLPLLPLILIDPSGADVYIPGWTIEGFGTQPPGVTTSILAAYIKDQCTGASCWP